MTLEEFKDTIIGDEMNEMSVGEIEKAFKLYNAIFEVAFYSFMQSRKVNQNNNAKRC